MAGKGFDWKFIELKLEKDDKQRMADFIDEYDGNVWQAVEDVLELQYKVSISWVSTHSSYCVTVSGNEKTGINDRSSITSWSDDLVEAYAMMSYKVLTVCKSGDWKEYAQEKAIWG